MSEALRQAFEEVVERARRLTRSDGELIDSYYKNSIIREAGNKIQQSLASGVTLTDGLELARHALRRLREECPEENEFRRAVRWLTSFIYPVCSSRFVQGRPKEASSAVAMARACLPLLAIARDEIGREQSLALAVRTLAPYIVLLPNQSDTSSEIESLRGLLRSFDEVVRALLGSYYEQLTKKLLESLDESAGVETVDAMEDYIWNVLSRVREDASFPRKLFAELSETDQLPIHDMQPLLRLFFLHLAFLPQDQQSALLRESVKRMESWEPMRVRDAFYAALACLRLLHKSNFIGEPLYQRFEAMFRYMMLPVLGKFVAESFRANSPTMEILERDYGISPYHALGLFAWDRILSGNPPPYIRQAQQLLYESFAEALCADGLDKSVFD